jgi:hypothetical protein
MKTVVLGVVLCVFAACTPDRVFPPNTNTAPLPTSSLLQNITINEFLASGNGTESDWFELFNTGNVPVTLEAGKIFFTDDLASPTKFSLPYSISIPPKGFRVIYCDVITSTPDLIYTGFALSKSGEQLGVFVKDSMEVIQPIDTLSFGPQTTSISYGRTPDGSDTWTFFNSPTPNESNL